MWKPLFKYAVIFIVVVVAVVFSRLMGPRLFFNALVKKDYVEKEGFSETIPYSFNEDGCYAIGLVSRSKKMSWYATNGQYKIEFLDSNGTLIDDVEITKNRTTSVFHGFRILDMYIFEVPFKGQYRDLKIRYTIQKPDSVLQSVEESIVLYLRPLMSGAFICGKELEKKENIETYGIKTYMETDPKFVPLFAAIKNKDFKTVESIFDHNKMRFDVKMSGNREPVHYAAYFNDVRTLRLLIDNKAELNPVDINGYTPIQYAIANNNYEIVKKLTENGVDIKSIKEVPNLLDGFYSLYDPENILFYSVSICSYDLLEFFIDNGIDINVTEKSSTDKDVNLIEYLNTTRCRYNFDSEITIETTEKYNNMKKLLIANGIKEKQAGMNPTFIGRKGK